MRKTDLEAIRAAIRRVRAERFPNLDQAFLESVLEIETMSSEDDVTAQRRIREAAERLGG